MTAALLLWAAALLAAAAALRRDPRLPRAALGQMRAGLAGVLPILAVAIPAAGFLAELVPERFAATLFGAGTGLLGHLAATVTGALLPGGPFVAFPVVLALWQAGAGSAQMVTLISAWSILGLHRAIVWEAPLLGWRFVALRLAASAWLPPLSGIAAEAILAWLPVVAPGR